MHDVAAQYERDGVVRVPQVFSPAEVAQIRQAIDDYVRNTVPKIPGSDYVYEKDGATVRNLWRMDRHSAYFRSIAGDPRIRQLIEGLIGPDIVLMGVETFNKKARVGSAVPPHQDNAYFCMTPPDVLTLWIAIDPVTQANGPVHYVLGSHKGGVRPHAKSGVAGNSMGIADPIENHEPYVALLDPGDALAHHSVTIHSSEPNTSDSDRCGLLMVFRAAHCQEDPALKQAYTAAP